MNKLTVMDLFCGAGGFSEGFRQRGFEIVRGVDNWRPAIDTFSHNFGIECSQQDIGIFGADIEAINLLPDTDVIVGSPPCVSFSSSNRCGKADKSLGIRLIEAFFRIIAVKMHKPDTRLKAWFMENVANSAKYTRSEYTFADLNLSSWSKSIGRKPTDIALNFSRNHMVINSADFGVAQNRKRLFAGEVVAGPGLPELLANVRPTSHISLEEIFSGFPSPFSRKNTISDPNYPGLALSPDSLTDHFYDAGIYEASWRGSQYLKTNHPYMGKMSFPENQQNPSRTVTSTKIVNSREALIYKDELGRKGDGEYRAPTIREIATLMSFPITYQFSGGENTKWKLVGNAVCPKVSSAIANELLSLLGLRKKHKIRLAEAVVSDSIPNLNNYQKQGFLSPPVRKENARFRRHPFKFGNMTVALSNYCLASNSSVDGKWRTTVTYGTGDGFKLQEIDVLKAKEQIFQLANESYEEAEAFFHEIDNGFSEKIADGKELQSLFEKNTSNHHLNPVNLVEEAAGIIAKYANGEIIASHGIFEHKDNVPKSQFYALYVMSHISAKANRK